MPPVAGPTLMNRSGAIAAGPSGDSGESCGYCRAGPNGIAGHERLFSYTISAREMHFACRACGRFWSRPLGAESPYVWRPIPAPAGHDVPGRLGTTPP